MDCTVHGVAKSRTWLSNFHFYFTFMTSANSWMIDLEKLKIKLFFKVYFIYCCVVYSLQCGPFLYLQCQASHCSGFSSCRAWTPEHMGSVVVVPGLKNTGSIAVSHGLSCSAACEIFPNQGLNLCVSNSGNQILYHWASKVVQNKTLI